MKNRVFITGMGALSSTGLSLDETWLAIKEGRNGIAPIQNYEVADWAFHLGGELKGFQPKKMLVDKKVFKLVSYHDTMGLVAASQAIEDAGLVQYKQTLSEHEEFDDNTGIYVGSPGNKFYQQYDFIPLLAKTNNMAEFAEKLFSEVHPMWLLKTLPNNVLAYTGIHYGFKGANQNITNHVVSGMQAVIEAFHAVQLGLIERAVVVAYDLGFEPEGLMNYGCLGILSEKALYAFDSRHDGTILGEGAAAIVIESENSMQTRQIEPYAEILNGVVNNDATGLFALDKQATQLTTLLKKALNGANLLPEDLGMITAHGNGNQRSDCSEALAINALNGEIPVTSFKWSTGHTLAASGLLDSILTVKALQQKSVPGLPYLEKPALHCESLSISNDCQTLQSQAAMVISRGFAAMNACLILKNCE